MRIPSWILITLMAASLAWIVGCPDDEDDDDASDDDVGDDDTGDDDTGDDDTGDDDTGDDDTGDDDTGDDDTGDDDTGDDDTGDDDTAGDDDTGDDDTFPQIGPGDLVITEIMYKPMAASDNDGEYIELINTTGQSFNMLGCTFTDIDNDSHQVSASVPVAPNGRVVLGGSTDPGVNGNIPVDYSWGADISLDHTIDELYMVCSAGEVDRVEWNTSLGWAGGDGIAMNLEETHLADNHEGQYWCDAITVMGNGDLGTPGAPNDVCIFVVDNDGDGYSPPEDCDDSDANINPGMAEDPANQIDDNCNGFIDEQPFSPGMLIFTEIMINPTAVGDSAGEWFEVLNTTANDVNLLGCVLSDDGVDQYTFQTPVTVPAMGRFVLGKSDDTGINGGITVDFAYGGWITLSNTAGDELVLTCVPSVEVDRVVFDGGKLWPNPEGATLSLDPDFENDTANDDPANWCEATTAIGNGDLGTPGALNDEC